MFIKFCGFTRIEDVEAAAQLPVSSIGYIFYKKSPRYITPRKAGELSNLLKGSRILKTGVFVDSSPEEIKKTAEIAGLDIIQVYDSRTAASLKGFLKTIECFRIQIGLSCIKLPDEIHGDYILFDSYSNMEFGGSGKRFNHQVLHNYRHMTKTIIAGGINPDNVGSVIKNISPGGLDISSGIEIEKGIKSSDLMNLMIQKIKEAQNESTP